MIIYVGFTGIQTQEGISGKALSRLDDFQQRKVIQYIKLVRGVVARMAHRLPQHIDVEDLVHSGILGLIGAVQRFQWGRDGEEEGFRAYAACRVRGQILDELRHLDILPRSLRGKVRNFKKAYEDLRQRFQRELTEREISTHMGMDLEACQKIRAQAYCGRSIVPENLHSAEDVEKRLHGEEIKRILAAEMDRLHERERQVVSLYYLKEMTFRQIGILLMVTESRVSQIHTAAMKKLMKRLRLDSSFDALLRPAHARACFLSQRSGNVEDSPRH